MRVGARLSDGQDECLITPAIPGTDKPGCAYRITFVDAGQPVSHRCVSTWDDAVLWAFELGYTNVLTTYGVSADEIRAIGYWNEPGDNSSPLG